MIFKQKILVIIFFTFYFFANINIIFAQKVAEKGIIDLSNIDFEQNKVIALNGDWEFYWKQLLEPEDFVNIDSIGKNYVKVPGIWNGEIVDNEEISGIGYCTYRLNIKLLNKEQNLAINIRDISLSYKLWIGDKLVAEIGKVSDKKENYFGIYKTSTRFFTVNKLDSSEKFIYLPVILQIANFEHPRGAIWDEIYFGSQEQIGKDNKNKLIINFIIIGIVLIMTLYHFGLFLMRRKEMSLLFFALTALVYFVRGLATNERIIVDWFPHINFEIINTIEYFSSYGSITFFVLFFASLYKQYFPKILKIILVSIGTFIMAIIIFTPVKIYGSIKLFYDLFTLGTTIYLSVFLLILTFKNVNGAFLAFIGIFIGMFAVIINDILYSMTIIQSIYLLPYGFVFYIFVQSIVLARNFSHTYTQIEELTIMLDYQNKNLEEIVTKRTAEISLQKEEILTQKEQLEVYNEKMQIQNYEIYEKNIEITEQRDILQKANKHVTASITYASRIQQAIIPSDVWADTTFADHFVFWKPKDIVSGDFFWLKIFGKYTIIAVADSTGHGVPGAFMSMLGISILNDIVTYRNAKMPGQVLNEMRHAVKKLLNQKGDSTDQKDGFDISLCSIDNVINTLYYSGANLPIYLTRNKELTEFKPNRNPISIYLKERQFETHEFELLQNDNIYMFSDGFIDLIGGERNEKFKTKRFKDLLIKIYDNNLSSQKQLIEETKINWMSKDYEQVDDILIIGIKI